MRSTAGMSINTAFLRDLATSDSNCSKSRSSRENQMPHVGALHRPIAGRHQRKQAKPTGSISVPTKTAARPPGLIESAETDHGGPVSESQVSGIRKDLPTPIGPAADRDPILDPQDRFLPATCDGMSFPEDRSDRGRALLEMHAMAPDAAPKISPAVRATDIQRLPDPPTCGR